MRARWFAVLGTLAACSAAHHRDDASTRDLDAGATERDASTVRDAGARADAALPPDPVPPPPVVIGGETCTGLLPTPRAAAACDAAGAFSGSCEAIGPSLRIVGHEGCASDDPPDHVHEIAGPFELLASCSGAAIRWAGGEVRLAELRFGGSASIAAAIADTDRIDALHVGSKLVDGYCLLYSGLDVTLSDGTPISIRIVEADAVAPLAVIEAAFGAPRAVLHLDRIEGHECDVLPRCGRFEILEEGSIDTGPSGLLRPCATSLLLAPIGGCGDSMEVSVTAGTDGCGSTVRLGLVWPIYRPLCH